VRKLKVPDNARVVGNAWYCIDGYKKVSEACELDPNYKRMSIQEMQEERVRLVQEQRKILIDLQEVRGAGAPSASASPCNMARASCSSRCSSVSIFDYESGDYITTNFNADCSSACDSGALACEFSTVDERCDEFLSDCESSCSFSVISNSGDFLYLTNSEDECRDACRSGESACDAHGSIGLLGRHRYRRCTLEPFKPFVPFRPFRPFGCIGDQVFMCVCDSNGHNCGWQWVCDGLVGP